MQIIIGGDLVPTESNLELFSSANIEKLLGKELHTIWESADVRIFNLEVPLSDEINPIIKKGPNLISPTKAVRGIKALNPSLINLSNNHILDQGLQGLKSTMDLLNENNIPNIGAGENIYEASRPYILSYQEKKVGIYSCSEHEFSVADEKKAGSNPFDPLESLDHINALKEKCDYVIVLYHGGLEHYRYPSPYLQKVCHKIVEKGADLIVCQHSHCIGCFEKYQNSTILYGQGNFIFDRSESEFWQTSILIKVDLDNDAKIEYIPVVKKGNTVVLSTGQSSRQILEEFNKRSEEILDSLFISKNYKKLANEKIKSYMYMMNGFGKWIARIDRFILNKKLSESLYNKKRLLAMQNYIECEAHREMILTGIKGELSRFKEEANNE